MVNSEKPNLDVTKPTKKEKSLNVTTAEIYKNLAHKNTTNIDN